MIKILAGAVALCLAAPAVPEDYIVVANPAVEQMVCDRGMGTAFRISKDTFVTAAHVSVMSGCKVGGKPYKLVYTDGAKDYAVLTVSIPGKGLRIDCGGFKAGEHYYSEGYALGHPFQRLLPVTGTGMGARLRFAGPLFAVVGGNRFIPGMSGGPVLNGRGEVVGIVNAYTDLEPVSFSREMASTYLCRK